MRFLLSLFASVILCSCESTRDVTQHPGAKTDFVPSRSYALKEPVFIYRVEPNEQKKGASLAPLGYAGTPRDVEQFRASTPRDPQVLGVLMPGDIVKVTQFLEESSLSLGTFFKVFARIESGPHKGTVVDLNLISKEKRPTAQAHVDPAYLQPLEP